MAEFSIFQFKEYVQTFINFKTEEIIFVGYSDRRINNLKIFTFI